MGRLAPDSRPIAADILRGRSSSPQLCTTEEASFISKAPPISALCGRPGLVYRRTGIQVNSAPGTRIVPWKRSIWQDPSGKKWGGRSQIPRDARVLLGEIPLMEVPRISLDP